MPVQSVQNSKKDIEFINKKQTQRLEEKQPQNRIEAEAKNYKPIINLNDYKPIKSLNPFFASYRIISTEIDWDQHNLTAEEISNIKKACAILSIKKPQTQKEIIAHYDAYAQDIETILKNIEHDSLAYLGILVIDKKMQLKTAYFLEGCHQIFSTTLKLALSFTSFALSFLRLSFINSLMASPTSQLALAIALMSITLYTIGKVLLTNYKNYKRAEADLKAAAFDPSNRPALEIGEKIERITTFLNIAQKAFDEAFSVFLKMESLIPQAKTS